MSPIMKYYYLNNISTLKSWIFFNPGHVVTISVVHILYELRFQCREKSKYIMYFLQILYLLEKKNNHSELETIHKKAVK